MKNHDVEQLIAAIKADNPEQVKNLLDQGANPNGVLDRDSITPLCFAVQKHNLAIINTLLMAGANPHYYVTNQQLTVVELARASLPTFDYDLTLFSALTYH